MNVLGTSAADNKKFDDLKVEPTQHLFYGLANPYFEKCEKIKPGDETVIRMIKAINVSLSNK